MSIAQHFDLKSQGGNYWHVEDLAQLSLHFAFAIKISQTKHIHTRPKILLVRRK